MKLYRIRNEATGQYYRHKCSQFRGGDWVNERDATIWTKPGGASSALGALREKARHARKAATLIIEIAVVEPALLQWRPKAPAWSGGERVRRRRPTAGKLSAGLIPTRNPGSVSDVLVENDPCP